MTTQDVGIPLKGSLSQVSFPEIVRVLGETKATGALYLLDGDTKKIVFFEGGQPVFVRSNVAAECLGQQLARERLITQDQCDQTLEAIKRTGKKQGELLVEMGILSEGNLRHGLTHQLRRKLVDIFGWVDGRFQFKPGPHGQDFGIRIDATPESVIVSAVLETFSEGRAREALDKLSGYPVLDAELDADELGLMDEERHHLRNLDGTRTIAQVLTEGASPPVPNAAALLYAAIAAGLVSLATTKASASARVAWAAPAELAAPDDDFTPSWASTTTITEFEDTPLPGALPQRQVVLGAEDDAIFAEVEGRAAPAPAPGPGELSGLRTLPVDEELIAAEVDSIDETFDADDIELLADDAELEDDIDALSPEAAMAALRAESGPVAAALGVSVDEVVGAIDDDLVLPDASAADLLGDDFDLPDDLTTGDLDEVDALEDLEDAELTDDGDDLEGARIYGRAESALAAGDWPSAAALFDRAFNAGFDSAELHAHLAWARWNSDPTGEMGDHALQLLDYASSLEPNLDLVHAYRAAILANLGDAGGALQAARRALDLNPYNDVANDVIDRLG
jgi:hypothetical protein